jgi:predicted esterase
MTAGGFTAGGITAGGIISGGFTAGGIISGGFTGGMIAGGAGDAGMVPGDASLPVVTGGTEPKIPPVNGECPEFKNGTIMVAGHRGIQITVGEANKKGPIYFFWHGTGGSAGNVSMVPAQIRNEVIQMGGIIASFNGASSSGAEGDCSGTGAHNKADFKAADQIVACAVKNHGIDPRRIYTTGCSAGGLQSGCMAQMRSSYIAASAPNSGGVVFPEKWEDNGKPAIFTMHGGDSDWVIVTFSETSATLDMNAKQHGSFVVNCNHGGGHCGAPAPLYLASWRFMKDHPYGVESPWKGGIPSGAGIPDYCKIY